MSQLIFDGMDIAQSRALAARLGERIVPGMFICLYGGLGAGKTTFLSAMAEELGVTDISSPTFTIVHEHTTASEAKLCHFDAYRLAGEDELFAMGFEDYLRPDCIIFMEWADIVASALPDERLDITIGGNGSSPRRYLLDASGEKYDILLSEVAQ